MFAATTSEGVPIKVVRKIKPPSATFLQGGKPEDGRADASTEEGVQVAEDKGNQQVEGGSRSVELTGPAEPPPSFEIPEVSLIADDPPKPPANAAEPAKAAEPANAAEPATAAEPAKAAEPATGRDAPAASAEPAKTADPAPPKPADSGGYTQERLMAELKELDEIVSSVESLKFLKPRVQRSLEEGADAMTLVSFYRLAARSLKDETGGAKQTAEQLRREFELMRSKASKLELELATALALSPAAAQPPQQQQAGAPAGGAAETPGSSKRVQELEHELKTVNEQREKLLVDFKNMRDRSQKDVDLKLFKEKERFFKNFLPVLDSFERATQTMDEKSGIQTLLEGFKMISGQLMEALRAEGLEPIDVNCPFDPRFHEAVGEVQTQEKEDEWIYDELSRGYKLGERLIRPAMVRIARNPSGVVVPKEPKTEE